MQTFLRNPSNNRRAQLINFMLNSPNPDYRGSQPIKIVNWTESIWIEHVEHEIYYLRTNDRLA